MKFVILLCLAIVSFSFYEMKQAIAYNPAGTILAPVGITQTITVIPSAAPSTLLSPSPYSASAFSAINGTLKLLELVIYPNCQASPIMGVWISSSSTNAVLPIKFNKGDCVSIQAAESNTSSGEVDFTFYDVY